MYQDQEQEAPAMPYPIATDKADLLDKINPDKVVEQLKNKLMGREFDKQTNLWVSNPYLKKNAVSELCANEMANLILSVSNANVSISKLKDDEIRKRAYSIMKTAVSMMMSNWAEYKITNTAQLDYVANIVFSIAFITMKQADNEGIRKMIVGTRTEVHSINEYGQSEKPKRKLLGRRR